jgi:uncharacterized protein YjbJ (UPF0337 family)
MGSTADKASGYANEVAGNIKKNVGKIVGSEKQRLRVAFKNSKARLRSTLAKPRTP